LNLDNLFVNSVTVTKLGSESTHVFCSQYVNNLKVLSNSVIYHFDRQGLYSSISGELISTINITTSPSMSVCNVIAMFSQSATNDGFVGTKDHTSQIDTGCVTCELGYYDLNAGSGNSTHNFKRAWRIRTNGSSYPYAYINDSDHSLISYDNGVVYN
jgi:Zn-dependent metalloprotease